MYGVIAFISDNKEFWVQINSYDLCLFLSDNCVKENCVFKRSSCCRQFEIITNNQKKENEKKNLNRLHDFFAHFVFMLNE